MIDVFIAYFIAGIASDVTMIQQAALNKLKRFSFRLNETKENASRIHMMRSFRADDYLTLLYCHKSSTLILRPSFKYTENVLLIIAINLISTKA